MAHHLAQSRIEDPVWLKPNDITLLKTRLSEAETLLQSIEYQIDELSTGLISELTSQKDAKLVEIALLKNALAPVRRVSVEILSEIFMLSCISEHLRWQYDLVPRTFTLTSVCVAWRKAAHSTPRLWSRLSFCLEDQLLSSNFVWAHDWITRSGTLPLEFYLDLCVERDNEASEAYKERGRRFLEYILAHFGHKIRLLDMFGLPSSFIPLLHLPPSSLSSTFPRQVEIFLNAPKLRHIQIDNTLFLDLFALPAEQLILLKVDTVGVESDPVIYMDILRVLPRCTQLVTLVIFLASSQDLTGENTTFQLPVLKSLTTIWCSDDNILRHITAPLLEQLSLTYKGENLDDLTTIDLTSLQQRSAFELSSLTLTHLRFGFGRDKESSEKVLTILSLFSTIHSLKIRSVYDVNPLIQEMTFTKNHHLLPNLKHLELTTHSNYMDNLSVSGLKSMVLSRWRPAQVYNGSVHNGLSCLQEVAVSGFQSRGEVEHVMQMAELSGLVLDYTPGRPFAYKSGFH